MRKTCLEHNHLNYLAYACHIDNHSFWRYNEEHELHPHTCWTYYLMHALISCITLNFGNNPNEQASPHIPSRTTLNSQNTQGTALQSAHNSERLMGRSLNRPTLRYGSTVIIMLLHEISNYVSSQVHIQQGQRGLLFCACMYPWNYFTYRVPWYCIQVLLCTSERRGVAWPKHSIVIKNGRDVVPQAVLVDDLVCIHAYIKLCPYERCFVHSL